VGILGYCWGGTVAWVAAARVPGLACAVPYYGGGMPNFIGEKPKCPVMCHFGEQDQSPTLEQAKKIVAAHPGVTAHYYPAGHGFNCDQRPSYHAESSRQARERTVAFLRQHVG
jgi:carboxymethylenebutenolidase